MSQVMRPSGYASNLDYNFDFLGLSGSQKINLNYLSPQWHMITRCCQVSSWLTIRGESTDHGVQAEIYARGDAAG